MKAELPPLHKSEWSERKSPGASPVNAPGKPYGCWYVCDLCSYSELYVNQGPDVIERGRVLGGDVVIWCPNCLRSRLHRGTR